MTLETRFDAPLSKARNGFGQQHEEQSKAISPRYGLDSSSQRSQRSVNLARVSLTDALILREILQSRGRISSLDISRKTDVPLTSVQRHRKRVEEKMVKTTFNPIYSSFELREVMVDVRTQGGYSMRAIAELRDYPNVVYLSRVHGDTGFTIRIKIIIKSDLELADWLERIKAVEGVQDIRWTETIEEISSRADMMQLLNMSKIIEASHAREE